LLESVRDSLRKRPDLLAQLNDCQTNDHQYLHGLNILLSDLAGFHHQQYNAADKGEGAYYRRNKVAMSGLNVRAEEIDRVPWRREANARVSEHNDAQGNQNDGNYRFCVHVDLLFFLIVVKRVACDRKRGSPRP
jgi:hypothetical protein